MNGPQPATNMFRDAGLSFVDLELPLRELLRVALGHRGDLMG